MSKEIKSDNLKISILAKENQKEIFKCGEGKIAETGVVVIWDGEGQPMQGMEIAVQTPEGGFLPAPDGVITLEDGTVIEIAGGIITKAEVPNTNTDAPEAPATTETPMENKEEGLTPKQEAAVKRVIESSIKETHFSEEQINKIVDAKLDAKLKELTEKLESSTKNSDEITAKFNDAVKENGELKEKLNALFAILEKTPAKETEKKDQINFKPLSASEQR